MTGMQITECIDNCTKCYQMCLQTAMNHCLDKGNEYTEPSHFRLMLNCAKICETSAYFQLSSSELSAKVCGICAYVCEECAKNCEELGGMDECVAACRKCAASCRQMAA